MATNEARADGARGNGPQANRAPAKGARTQVVRASATLPFDHAHVPGTSGWTLLLLHGTGGDEHQLIELGRRLAPEATLLSPRGKEMEGGTTRRFFRRHSITELDIEDLVVRTDELAGFVRAAAGAYGCDPARTVAVGYSNGANIAVSLVFRHPELLRGAALFRATLPYEPDTAVALEGKEILVAAGEHDSYVPPATTRRLVEVFEAGGARVTLRSARTGHELTPGDVDAAVEWLALVTGGKAP